MNKLNSGMLLLPLVGALLTTSCFDPKRSENLACSADGQCPGTLICASDDYCRDQDLDGSVVDAFVASPDATSPIQVDATVITAIVPVGKSSNTNTVGNANNESPFGPFTCAEGEVVYGISSRVISGFIGGFCEFRIKCGQLLVDAEEVTLVRNEESVPPTGVRPCSGGILNEEDLDCPDDRVVVGLLAESSISSGAPKELRLKCANISHTAEVSTDVMEVGVLGGGAGTGQSIELNCPAQQAVTGFKGTADLFSSSQIRSMSFSCRSLTPQ